MWGDKDTFPLAFALAGKAHLYSQVGVPPGEHSAARALCGRECRPRAPGAWRAHSRPRCCVAARRRACP